MALRFYTQMSQKQNTSSLTLLGILRFQQRRCYAILSEGVLNFIVIR